MLRQLKRNLQIDWWGHHGVRHWARVRRNGRIIARHVQGVDTQVTDLFAILHDCRRVDEWEDPSHGWRAMAWLRKLHSDSRLGLTESQFWQLLHAIEHHSGQHKPHTVTIAACWNADRYDLGRVGIEPDEIHMAPGALLPRRIWQPLHEQAMAERAKLRRMKGAA